MLADRTTQASLRAHAFRPYEDRQADDGHLDVRRFHSRPLLTKSARAMLGHWQSAARREQPLRRPT